MSLQELQTNSLNYTFQQQALLEEALTHPSLGAPNYQRLEFLGDRILGLVIANWLFQHYPQAQEGELSRRFMAMVKEPTLAHIASRWRLAPHIRLGAGESLKPSILADAVEAVLGAAYIDGGLEAATAMVLHVWQPLINTPDEKDPKSRLQELTQGQGHPLPEYKVEAEDGPAHQRIYTVRVVTPLGEGVGSGASKQVAGAAAAQNLLSKL